MKDNSPPLQYSPWPESPEICSAVPTMVGTNYSLLQAGLQCGDTHLPLSSAFRLLTSHFAPDLLRNSSLPAQLPTVRAMATVDTL